MDYGVRDLHFTGKTGVVQKLGCFGEGIKKLRRSPEHTSPKSCQYFGEVLSVLRRSFGQLSSIQSQSQTIVTSSALLPVKSGVLALFARYLSLYTLLRSHKVRPLHILSRVLRCWEKCTDCYDVYDIWSLYYVRVFYRLET